MARGISLKRYEESVVDLGPLSGFRLRIEVSRADNMPEEVFLFLREPIDVAQGITNDDFHDVASPEDLLAYPVDEPNETQSPAYFRKAYVDIIVPTRLLALEAWDAIHTRVCNLCEALSRKDVLSLVEEVRCGDPVETEESESQSDSQSSSES